MKWTKKRPDKVGWYWLRWNKDYTEICCVYIARGEMCFIYGLGDDEQCIDSVNAKFDTFNSVEFSTEPIKEPAK